MTGKVNEVVLVEETVKLTDVAAVVVADFALPDSSIAHLGSGKHNPLSMQLIPGLMVAHE